MASTISTPQSTLIFTQKSLQKPFIKQQYVKQCLREKINQRLRKNSNQDLKLQPSSVHSMTLVARQDRPSTAVQRDVIREAQQPDSLRKLEQSLLNQSAKLSKNNLFLSENTYHVTSVNNQLDPVYLESSTSNLKTVKTGSKVHQDLINSKQINVIVQQQVSYPLQQSLLNSKTITPCVDHSPVRSNSIFDATIEKSNPGKTVPILSKKRPQSSNTYIKRQFMQTMKNLRKRDKHYNLTTTNTETNTKNLNTITSNNYHQNQCSTTTSLEKNQEQPKFTKLQIKQAKDKSIKDERIKRVIETDFIQKQIINNRKFVTFGETISLARKQKKRNQQQQNHAKQKQQKKFNQTVLYSRHDNQDLPCNLIVDQITQKNRYGLKMHTDAASKKLQKQVQIFESTKKPIDLALDYFQRQSINSFSQHNHHYRSRQKSINGNSFKLKNNSTRNGQLNNMSNRDYFSGEDHAAKSTLLNSDRGNNTMVFCTQTVSVISSKKNSQQRSNSISVANNPATHRQNSKFMLKLPK